MKGYRIVNETTAAVEYSDHADHFLSRAHHLLIGDDWRPASSGETLDIFDPATASVIGSQALGGPAEVDLAVAAADGALRGAWSRIAPRERSRLIYQLADLLESNAEEFAELESIDNGKPIAAARAVDIPHSVDWLRYFAGWPTKLSGEAMLAGQNDTLYYSRTHPVGVCALIVPWNYPLLMAMWKVAPALAAGCTMILKPAEQTPLTSLRFAELVLDAGIPPGVVNVVTGDGRTGAALVEHPGVNKVSFTGSTPVGREIAAKAGASLKRVTLELGGKSPSIVLPDADLNQAIAGSFSGIYYNAGQSCNAGSRLYVPWEQFDEVVSRIAELARRTTPARGLDPDCTLGPVVSKEQFDRVNDYIATGVGEGAELVAGGVATTGDAGWFISPTLFAATDDRLTVSREEIFGPVLVASPYRDLEEVIGRANDTEFGLAAGLWTRDVSTAHKVAARLQAGTIYVNRWAQSGPEIPFGGMKASGLGREHGRVGIDAYLEHQSILVDVS